MSTKTRTAPKAKVVSVKATRTKAASKQTPYWPEILPQQAHEPTFDQQRQQNKAEFKQRVTGAVVDFEVNKRRIDVQESLLNANLDYTEPVQGTPDKDCGCKKKEKSETSFLVDVALNVALLGSIYLISSIVFSNDY